MMPVHNLSPKNGWRSGCHNHWYSSHRFRSLIPVISSQGVSSSGLGQPNSEAIMQGISKDIRGVALSKKRGVSKARSAKGKGVKQQEKRYKPTYQAYTTSRWKAHRLLETSGTKVLYVACKLEGLRSEFKSFPQQIETLEFYFVH